MSNNKYKDLYIILPAYNEESRIHLCLQKIVDLGFSNIIVVNDASTDDTASIAASYDEVTVVSHLINLGPGGATQTGFEYAINNNAEYIATIDADFQHDPSDLVKLYDRITSEKYDLIVGSRFLDKNSIPFLRILYNKVGNLISYILTNKYLTDSQSGLKIMRADLAEKIAIETNGFEFCMEIISSAKSRKAKISEIPVSVRYDEATTRKGQNFSSGVSMMTRLFSPFN